MTHPDHFVSDIDKGFLTFHVKLDLSLNTDMTKLNQIDDPNNLYKLFVGFKSSNQLFDRLEILHNNVNVGYQQNECIREGFLYSSVKPEAEKKRRRFVHSLWENISAYSQTHAGAYINLNSFKNNGRSEVEFDLNVPFDDLLALQAFDLFPNGVIGDLSIRFQVSPAGLVWAVLDPYTVAEAKVFLEDNDSITMAELEKLKEIKARGHLKHQFTQICNEAVIPGPGDSPEPGPTPTPDPDPTPKPTKYEMKYEIREQYTSASGGDFDVLVEGCSFVFSFTDEEFTELGIEKTEDNKAICQAKYTKYLIVEPLESKKAKNFVKQFHRLITTNDIQVNTIKCDGERAFVSEVFQDYCKGNKAPNKIKLIIDDSPFTNAHKCVDAVIRTLRNAFGLSNQRMANTRMMKQMVEWYNNTPHSALRLLNPYYQSFDEEADEYLSMKQPKYIYLTPNQMQNDRDLEWQYIRAKKME